MYKRAQKVRLIIVCGSYLLVLLIILGRLLYVQVLNSSYYIKLAESQHQLRLTLSPQRGLIYDRNKKILALSLSVYSVYAVPRAIENKEAVAVRLSKLLGLDYSKVLTKLKLDKSFIWIKRRISDQDAQAVKALRLTGIDLLRENKRYYPNGSLAAHIIGFAGVDEDGLEGIELQYNDFLKGRAGHRFLLRDAKQRIMPAFEYEFVPATDGYNLVLTIDEVIQHLVEEELDKAFAKSNAVGASVVVLDPYNGEILAIVNRPGYDLNMLQEVTTDMRRNRALCDYFEPGSTFKIITACAALEEHAVALNDVFFCENGEYRVANHTLHDHRPHGKLTFVEVIEKSSNIGTVKIAQKLGEKVIDRYVRAFDFGKKTGIDLPGETAGFLRPLNQWSKLSISAIPIGHEIGVTVLQMAKAMAVIANGGHLVKPHVVQKITNSNETIKVFEALPSLNIISKETAETMRQILKGVVDNGTGQHARIPGYESAGKTGTAQKIDSSGRYSRSKYIASFIGFVPVAHPRFVIAVVFDEPHPVYYGGSVCAPVFRNIAEKILRYMDVPEQVNKQEKKIEVQEVND
ncbi:MAG: penicillin-binding protein 2 [Candidatus Omnitrophica bacterium]|nr:penicillin-binding protein 2 [Candidatus Omnitrophota bacterium]MBU4478009.1 penicillin-binding protein 2 [Candidatus Omnitrophota bacterium]MCG2703942.1 penicillin-binding protein 2 [Candidatus Omnitrophota bacterium]